MKKGMLTYITGPMKSGKTEHIISFLGPVMAAGQKFIIFKPRRDTSTGEYIESRAGTKMSAISIANAEELFSHLPEGCNVIVIDEVHLFEDPMFGDWRWLVPAVQTCMNRGIEIVISGLDMDFAREPFGTAKEFASRAHTVHKVRAVCDTCKGRDRGVYTQRWRDGKPDSRHSPRYIVKGSEAENVSVRYGVACLDCHRLLEESESETPE